MLPVMVAGAGIYVLLVGVDCKRFLLCQKPHMWTRFRPAIGVFATFLLLNSLATSEGLLRHQTANWEAKSSWSSLPSLRKSLAAPALPPKTNNAETSTRSGFNAHVTNTKNPVQNTSYSKEGIDLYWHIYRLARRHGVDPLLVRAIIRVESNFNPEAVSHRGAMGLMQIMRGTARSLGVRNLFDIRENLDGGIRYMRMLLQRNGWNLELALASYNAGPTTVRRYKGIPPYRETRRYVWKVIREYRNLKHTNKIFRETVLKDVFVVPTSGLENYSTRTPISGNPLIIY